MSFPMKSLRSSLKTASNKECTAATKKKHKAFKSNLDLIDKIKRTAENSPEEGPDRKRSVFGDLTNVGVLEATVTALDTNVIEPRITRSQSGAHLKLSQESHQQLCSQEEKKAKRTSNQSNKTIVNRAKLEESENATSGSQDTFYESANESIDATINISSSSESSHSVAKKSECPEEQSSGLPEGVTDFDKETGKDPFSVPGYARDIFQHLKERETKFIVTKYMHSQREISKYMRAVLVDWMAEVQESFELNHETLYLAVKLLDMYLSKESVTKTHLQLVGSTALLVASKYDERCPPALSDFVFICDDAYTRHQLIRMEIKLLKCVDFELGAPLSYTFLRRYARCSKQTMELLTLARYILELSLLEYDFVDVPDSMMAAAALSLALRMSKMESWNATLEYYSGYTLSDVFSLVCRLNKQVAGAKHRTFQTIPTKYSHKVFFEVANIAALDECVL